MAHCLLVRFRQKHRSASPVAILLALVLMLLSGCSGQLPLPPVIPGTAAPDNLALTPTGPGTPIPVPAPSRVPGGDVLALPVAFRYEVTLRPVQADAPATVVTGQYQNGAWAQAARTGDQPGEELISRARSGNGPIAKLHPRGRRQHLDTLAGRHVRHGIRPGLAIHRAPAAPVGDALAEPEQAAEPNATPGGAAAAGEVKTQALFSTEVVQRLLMAGVLTVASDEDTRRSLEDQIAPFFVPQTVTYWTDAAGRVTKVASTLLTLGPNSQPIPWVELTGSYSAYGDPAIAVAAPANATDIADLAGQDQVAEQASDVQSGVNLRVRVFATAGQPATDSVVTAYPTGKKTVAEEKLGPDAQFKLKPGTYDVLVRSGGAQQWLKGVAVTQGGVASNDVLFDFAQLTVNVNMNGNTVPVDVVVYPAGETTNFAGFVSENPARFKLPVGVYDVEAATQDGRARKRVTGVEVRSGLETTLAVDLAQP